MKTTFTCARCSQQKNPVKVYPINERITFRGRNLCPACYKEAIETDKFNNFVCELFGIKSAGPRIYTQRKRLHEQGYTDATIMNTLEYCFRVKKYNKTEESLGLVPYLVDEAYEWHQNQKSKVVELEEVRKEEKVVQIKKQEKKKQLLDFDFLDEEDEE